MSLAVNSISNQLTDQKDPPPIYSWSRPMEIRSAMRSSIFFCEGVIPATHPACCLSLIASSRGCLWTRSKCATLWRQNPGDHNKFIFGVIQTSAARCRLTSTIGLNRQAQHTATTLCGKLTRLRCGCVCNAHTPDAPRGRKLLVAKTS